MLFGEPLKVSAWCFSPKTTFNYGATYRRRGDHKRRWKQRILEADRVLYNAYTAGRAAQPSTQFIYGNGFISCN